MNELIKFYDKIFSKRIWRSLAEQIVDVQPMTKPTGTIFKLKYRYLTKEMNDDTDL